MAKKGKIQGRASKAKKAPMKPSPGMMPASHAHMTPVEHKAAMAQMNAPVRQMMSDEGPARRGKGKMMTGDMPAQMKVRGGTPTATPRPKAKPKRRK